jgi:hypothetical protein
MSDTLVVLFDKVAYMAKPAWTGARPEQVVYRRGDEVDAESFADSILGDGQRELDRLVELGAIGSPEVLARTAAAQAAVVAIPAGGTAAYSEEELSRMKAEDLAAIGNQHPDLIDRIVRIEALKGAKARKSVLALHPDYRDGMDVDELVGALSGTPSEDDGSVTGEAAPHVPRR